MDTVARIPMPTDSAAVLTLSQWLSPNYPVGSFSYSHGLEWAVMSGAVHDEVSLKTWLEDVLAFGAGMSDALFLAAAFWAMSPDEVAEIDAMARAFAPSSERLLETSAQGTAFCLATRDVWRTEMADMTYPVAVGRAARLADLPLRLTAEMFVHAFAANIVMAATRLAPIGQTAAQRLIRDLAPLCTDIASRTEDGDLDRLSGTAFLADIQAMQHEAQHSRIFRT